MRSTPRSTLLLLLFALGAASCGRSRERVTADESPIVAPPPRGAAAADDPPAPPAPSCADDGWTTYGHDAARTSATGGCLFPPLRAAWSFRPRSLRGTPSHAARAVVDGGAVYVTGGIGPTPTVWRLDAATGAIVWTYVTMADATRDGWPTLTGGKVMLVDDGVYSIDAQTGRGHLGELDAWGESLGDGERLFAENDRHWDGYGLYVAAFDLDAKLLWRGDYDALVRFYTAPDVGGLAMEGGRLVHAAQHGPLRTTRLAAFDARSGELAWSASASPQSSPSMADGRVYGIERWAGEATDRLVARSASDGGVLWSRELAGARGPAPLLAEGRVLVHARDGVFAFDRATGALAWTAPLPYAATAVQSATTMAAATGSGTLAVVSGRAVHLLRLSDGQESWSGEPAPRAKRVEGPVIAQGALYLVADGTLLRLSGSSLAVR